MTAARLIFLLALTASPVKAQGINPIVPESNDLIQVIKPAFANPSNLYTTPPIIIGSNNIVYSGPSSPSNSWLNVNGKTISGTATAGINGQISPFQISIGADTVNASASPGYLTGLYVQDAPAAGFIGGRASIQGLIAVVGTPGAPPTQAGLVGVLGQAQIRANLTGTAGAYVNYAGAVFGGNSQVIGQSGATFVQLLNGHEFDASCETGCSTAELHAATFVLTSDSINRGVYDDGAILIGTQGGSQTWKYGIEFGGYGHAWPFDVDSTLIYAWTRQAGGSSSPVALNGADFSNVTFQSGGCAFKSTGFCINPTGQIAGSLTTPSSSSATCVAGLVEWDASFIYICTATNTWKRATLASF